MTPEMHSLQNYPNFLYLWILSQWLIGKVLVCKPSVRTSQLGHLMSSSVSTCESSHGAPYIQIQLMMRMRWYFFLTFRNMEGVLLSRRLKVSLSHVITSLVFHRHLLIIS